MFLLVFAMVATEPDCAVVPNCVLEEPRIEFADRYTNNSYRFSAIIPDGLTAYDSPDPSPHHGFGLVLDSQHSYLYVDGSANSLEDKTPRDTANLFARHLRHDGKAIEATTIKPARLGALPRRGAHRAPHVWPVCKRSTNTVRQ